MPRSVQLCAMTALLLASCDTPETIIAWPGMTVAEFNRLNPDKAPLREDDDDGLAVSSPVTFIFRQGKDSIEFTENRSAGGLQMSTSRRLDDWKGSGPARVHFIMFNIGRPMEAIAAKRDEIAQHCARLARMTGTVPHPVANAASISRGLRAEPGPWHEMTLCQGRNGRIEFSIMASRYTGDGDFDRASFRGYLGWSMGPWERGEPKAAGRREAVDHREASTY